MVGGWPWRPEKLDFSARLHGRSNLGVGCADVADYVWGCVGRGRDEAVSEVGGGFPTDCYGGGGYVLV